MARKLFEYQGIRRRGGPLASGVTFVVYSDVAGTVLADISATSGGSAIAGSTITTADIAGLGPAAFRFYGPTDGTDTLWLRCPTDTSLGVQEIEADEDERLDALEAGGGGGHPNLATHDSMGLATDAELNTVNTALDGRLDIIETVIYVERFRAANVTDTATVTAATASVPVTGGAVLAFDPGRIYTLTAEVLCSGKDRLTVEGRGATIKASSATNWGNTSGVRHVLRFRDCTNLTISGLTVDGNGAALTGTAGWWVMLAIDSTYADNTVATKVARNVRVLNCDFKDLRAYGFGARLVNGLTLRGCTFTQGYQDASNEMLLCSVNRSDNVKVDGCDFDGGSNSSTTQGSVGSLLGVSPGYYTAVDPYALAINWCSIMNYLGLSEFTASPAVSGTADTTVSYTGANETTSTPDYITNDWYFFCVDAGSGTNNGIVPSDAIKVVSVNEGAKTFVVRRTAGDESGTSLNWAGQKIYYYTIKTSRFCQGVKVVGCTFKNSGARAGIFALGVADFEISGCSGSACEDIVLDVEYGFHGVIEGNTVDNPTGNDGISLLFFAQDVLIADNSIGRANHGIDLYSGYAAVNNVEISNNRLRGSGINFQSLSGHNWSDLVEDVLFSDNQIRGGVHRDGVGRLAAIGIQVGKRDSASFPGLVRNVRIHGGSIRNLSQWGVLFCGIDGLSFRDVQVSDAGFDAIFDANSNWQSTRVVVDNLDLTNLGFRGPSTFGLYRTEDAPTEPPRFGRVHWRNTQTALDDTQAWYIPNGTPAHPTGIKHDFIGGLVLRDNAGTMQKSADTTNPASGTWANLP